MIVPTIITLLGASTDVTSVVDDRIFPVAIPQKENRPSIVVAIGGNDPSGSNQGSSPVDIINFIIYIEGRTYADMDILSEKIRDVVEAYRGDVIDSIRFMSMNDQEYNEDIQVFSRIVTYRVRVNR